MPSPWVWPFGDAVGGAWLCFSADAPLVEAESVGCDCAVSCGLAMGIGGRNVGGTVYLLMRLA